MTAAPPLEALQGHIKSMGKKYKFATEIATITQLVLSETCSFVLHCAAALLSLKLLSGKYLLC